MAVPVVCAAEWQWAVDVANPPGGKSVELPRAFLWVPPPCRHVRAVVFAQHNMQEEPILEHPAFRRTLAELGFAEVFVDPSFDANFRFDQGAGERFDRMMRTLAERSGYAELATAPVVPMGHSAAASLPAYFAAWEPGRTLAYLSVSGQWPYVPSKDAPQAAGRSLDGVPGLITIGQYEWADQRAADGLKVSAAHPMSRTSSSPARPTATSGRPTRRSTSSASSRPRPRATACPPPATARSRQSTRPAPDG